MDRVKNIMAKGEIAHSVFKSHLLQMCQNASKRGKGSKSAAADMLYEGKGLPNLIFFCFVSTDSKGNGNVLKLHVQL